MKLADGKKHEKNSKHNRGVQYSNVEHFLNARQDLTSSYIQAFLNHRFTI